MKTKMILLSIFSLFRDYPGWSITITVIGGILIILYLIKTEGEYAHIKCTAFSSRLNKLDGIQAKYRKNVDVRIHRQKDTYEYHDSNGKWYFLTELEIAQIKGEIKDIPPFTFDLPKVRLRKAPKKVEEKPIPVLIVS